MKKLLVAPRADGSGLYLPEPSSALLKQAIAGGVRAGIDPEDAKDV